MNENIIEPDDEKRARLVILEAFKKRFVGEHGNCSPFAADVVVRYDTNVDALDVPEIHQDVRTAIEDFVKGIRNGEPSKIVILAGEPGMGKSHLLNHYRSPELAQQLGYVLVGNSNHWSVQDFETCLLDWILDALIRPSPNEKNLLLEKIQDIAYEALRQILARPGRLREFVGRKDAGFWRRQWAKLFGSGVGRYHAALKNRDDRIFRKLDFHAFADEVINRFLPTHASHPFHRHVLKCLLLYLFPEEREKVVHWLRKKNVEEHFVKRLGMGENIETKFQVIDIIKILVTLFSPQLSKGIHRQGTPTPGLVFFFAFDQMEGRNKLFEKGDWFLFFDKLSELYNTLPNIFFMFTMTLQLRNELYPDMERQFKSRIVRGDKFVLQAIPSDEILAVYRRRIARWLGDANAEIHSQLEDPRYRFLPFRAEEIVQVSQTRSLREFLVEIDELFQDFLENKVIVDDPQLEYLVSLNRLRDKAKALNAPFKFTENHLGTVTELMNRAGGALASSFGLIYAGMEPAATVDGLKALRLEFSHSEFEGQWFRVFLVHFQKIHKPYFKGCIELIKGKAINRHFLWLVRPGKIDGTVESERPGQILRVYMIMNGSVVCKQC